MLSTQEHPSTQGPVSWDFANGNCCSGLRFGGSGFRVWGLGEYLVSEGGERAKYGRFCMERENCFKDPFRQAP